MPVNDGQDRVTAYQMNLQLFAEGEGAGEATASAEPTSSPMDTLYEMKPIDGFATEDAGASNSPEAEPEPATQEPEAVPEAVKEQSPEANKAFADMRKRAEQLEGEIARRDAEIAKRFGDKGIKTFDDVVKGWDTAMQQQQEQQAQQMQQQVTSFQQQINTVVGQMREQGYDETTIQARVDSMVARFEIQQMRLERQQEQQRAELQQKQMEEQSRLQQQEAQAEQGTKRMLEEFASLKAEYGDLLPDIQGETPRDQLKSMWEQLDDATRDKVMRGYTLEDAFMVVHKDDILAFASKKSAQQTLNQVNGRAHLKPSGGTSEVETISIPEETLRMYKQLNPGRTHKEYLEHYKRSLKG